MTQISIDTLPALSHREILDTSDQTPQSDPRTAKHSPYFDAVALLPAARIHQPSLYLLAKRLQEAMIEDSGLNAPLRTVDDTAFKASLTGTGRDVQNESLTNADTDTNVDTDIAAQKLKEVMINTKLADASVLVAITNEESPKLLLTRRASHLNSHASEVSFAGGKYDMTDGNNVVTALREACEETGLPPVKVQLIGQLPTQISKNGLSVRPIVALVDPNVIYVPELGEIERIFWADFETLLTQPTTEYRRVYQHAKQQVTFLTPSWTIDGETVWGLTGRVIASLLKIGFEREVDWYYQPVTQA